jgi:Zn-dependent protease/CBS domain-containing protein
MTGLRLVRILGFEIRIDFSWFILFFLLLWTFSVGVFPREAPGLARDAYLIMGAAGALLFFSSLIAHELSHSLVARRKGIPVEGITLFVFGGMAHTRLEAESPGDEFQIAVVGPLTSLAAAAVFGLAAWAGSGLGLSAAAIAVLEYLAMLNIALAVFNLLPGFPLDGGRVFRALLWKLTGNATKATRVATALGRWLGYLIVLFGLYSAFIVRNIIGGVWLVFIGWFLRNAAISGYHQHMLLRVLSGVRAAQAMTPHPDTVPAAASVRALLDDDRMHRHYGAYPVIDHGRTLGIVTLHAIRNVPRDDWGVRTARDIMIPLSDLVTVQPDDHLVTVLDRLKDSPARRVLVLRGDQLAGIITPSDMAFWLERARQVQKP